MPVESPVNYITDLVKTNPLHTDGLGASDSHHRLIKTAVQQSFPNINAPVTATPTNLNNGYIPIGGIILWSGAISAIPANWHLCDGTSGTPNLRDRFVIGADADTLGTYNVGQTGGAASNSPGSTSTDGATVTDSQGTHTHTGATAAHTLLVSEIPAHTHNVTISGSGSGSAQVPGSGVFLAAAGSTGYVTDNGTGGGGGHSHNISSDGAHVHNAPVHSHGLPVIPTVPPYYALAYIQRIS